MLRARTPACNGDRPRRCSIRSSRRRRAGRARGEVDLLFGVLADVADDQIAGAPVEGEAPRIAQPVGPDLRTPPRPGREWIARWDRVAATGAGRDPQHLAEQDVRVLAIVVRVALAAAVTNADVEIAVRPELELSAVVVALAVMVDREHGPGAGYVGPVRIPACAPVLDDLNVVRAVGVVDVEPAAGLVVRRERHREQSLLAAGGVDLARDVEERTSLAPAANEDDDSPASLDDEQPTGVARRGGQVDRLAEHADPLQADAARASRVGDRGGAR